MGIFPLMAIGEANIAYPLRRIVGFRDRARILSPDFAGVYPRYCPAGVLSRRCLRSFYRRCIAIFVLSWALTIFRRYLADCRCRLSKISGVFIFRP